MGMFEANCVKKMEESKKWHAEVDSSAGTKFQVNDDDTYQVYVPYKIDKLGNDDIINKQRALGNEWWVQHGKLNDKREMTNPKIEYFKSKEEAQSFVDSIKAKK